MKFIQFLKFSLTIFCCIILFTGCQHNIKMKLYENNICLNHNIDLKITKPKIFQHIDSFSELEHSIKNEFYEKIHKFQQNSYQYQSCDNSMSAFWKNVYFIELNYKITQYPQEVNANGHFSSNRMHFRCVYILKDENKKQLLQEKAFDMILSLNLPYTDQSSYLDSLEYYQNIIAENLIHHIFNTIQLEE